MSSLSNVRTPFGDISKIPVHTDPSNEAIPICNKPITKEEYLDYVNMIRGDKDFDRLPFATWAYEEFPEFAERPEQIVGINAEFTRDLLEAKEREDLEAEKLALEKKVQRLKKMAKKNKAIREAKKRLEEIIARQAELEMNDDDFDIKLNDA